jgi:hypothetical protein
VEGTGLVTDLDEVYLAWHIHHAEFTDGRPTEHVDADGDLVDDNEDDIKLLGVYRTEERAQRRIDEARTEPGFVADPDCFWIETHTLDVDRWVGGFFTYKDGE